MSDERPTIGDVLIEHRASMQAFRCADEDPLVSLSHDPVDDRNWLVTFRGRAVPHDRDDGIERRWTVTVEVTPDLLCDAPAFALCARDVIERTKSKPSKPDAES